ncbi:ORM1-like protein 3 [Dysidea avara]|uniref:ORM1-like protein 3 n=1 Tax=Dysidea avara TaxID=196820 RepID=UPI00331BDB31
MNCVSESEANVSWLNSKGIWITYILIIVFIHFTLLCIVSIPVAWTLTTVLHSITSYLVLHYVKGTPFVEVEPGASSRLTHWEQMDEKYSQTKKFLCAVPTVLFILASFYTSYNFYHFIWNFLALLVALIPKLPELHRFRLWKINKY